jgi:hypothetical protein
MILNFKRIFNHLTIYMKNTLLLKIFENILKQLRVN